MADEPVPKKLTRNQQLGLRLAEILTRLNEGQTLKVQDLMRDFKTCQRTIERDLTERLAFLPWHHDLSQGYRLDPSYLGRLDFRDIRNFAALSGIIPMYPSLDRDFLRQLLDSRASLSFATKGQSYEDANQFKKHFERLRPAIEQHQRVSFEFQGSRRQVEPYKLIHHRGCWYLAAVEQGTLKAYRLSKMGPVLQGEGGAFVPSVSVQKQLEQEDSIWFGTQKQEVIVSVDPAVASYFQARALLPHQQIIRTLTDGSLLVSCQMVDSLQVLPLVRFWLPHLRIISPDSLREELMAGLKAYGG